MKPSILQTNGTDEGIAKWNELFIFEVPRRVSRYLETKVPQEVFSVISLN